MIRFTLCDSCLRRTGPDTCQSFVDGIPDEILNGAAPHFEPTAAGERPYEPDEAKASLLKAWRVWTNTPGGAETKHADHDQSSHGNWSRSPVEVSDLGDGAFRVSINRGRGPKSTSVTFLAEDRQFYRGETPQGVVTPNGTVVVYADRGRHFGGWDERTPFESGKDDPTEALSAFLLASVGPANEPATPPRGGDAQRAADEIAEALYAEGSSPEEFVLEADEGSLCDDVSCAIETRFGLPQVWGVYETDKGGLEPHSWNVTPEGGIVDGTWAQFQPHHLAEETIHAHETGSPVHARYREGRDLFESGGLLVKHGGPGVHETTGTPQAVHGGGRRPRKVLGMRGTMPWSGGDLPKFGRAEALKQRVMKRIGAALRDAFDGDVERAEKAYHALTESRVLEGDFGRGDDYFEGVADDAVGGWALNSTMGTAGALQARAPRLLGLARHSWAGDEPEPHADADLMAETILRSMYDDTQAWFDEQGITHVWLARGMQSFDGGPLYPLSSWSTDPDTARTFALKNNADLDYAGVDWRDADPLTVTDQIERMVGDDTVSYPPTQTGRAMFENPDYDWMEAEEEDEDGWGYGEPEEIEVAFEGLILMQEVPVERILGSPANGFGALNESEFVVLSDTPSRVGTEQKHGGPGVHETTGTPQAVHGSGLDAMLGMPPPPDLADLPDGVVPRGPAEERFLRMWNTPSYRLALRRSRMAGSMRDEVPDPGVNWRDLQNALYDAYEEVFIPGDLDYPVRVEKTSTSYRVVEDWDGPEAAPVFRRGPDGRSPTSFIGAMPVLGEDGLLSGVEGLSAYDFGYEARRVRQPWAPRATLEREKRSFDAVDVQDAIDRGDATDHTPAVDVNLKHSVANRLTERVTASLPVEDARGLAEEFGWGYRTLRSGGGSQIVSEAPDYTQVRKALDPDDSSWTVARLTERTGPLDAGTTLIVPGEGTQAREAMEAALSRAKKYDFETGKYVAAPVVFSEVTEELTQEEAERDVRYRAVAGMVQAWAQSSNDDHAPSLAVQDLAWAEFGASLVGTDAQAADWRVSAVTSEGVERFKSRYGYAAVEILKAMREETQEFWGSDPNATVRLFRGQEGEARPNYTPDSVPGEPVSEYVFRPLSSWTLDPQEARSFAGDGDAAVVYKADVPVWRLIGSALTGYGCFEENEFVVLGGPLKTESASVERSYGPGWETKHGGPGPHSTGSPQAAHGGGLMGRDDAVNWLYRGLGMTVDINERVDRVRAALGMALATGELSGDPERDVSLLMEDNARRLRLLADAVALEAGASVDEEGGLRFSNHTGKWEGVLNDLEFLAAGLEQRRVNPLHAARLEGAMGPIREADGTSLESAAKVTGNRVYRFRARDGDRDGRDAKIEVMESLKRHVPDLPEERLRNAMAVLWSEPPAQDIPDVRAEFAARIVSTWAATSNDEHKVALLVQDRAEEIFGMDRLALGWDTDPTEFWSGLSAEDEEQAERDAQNVVDDVLRGMYADTQESFAKDGITEVTLWRGMKDRWVPTGAGGYRVRPLSSWSADKSVASRFVRGPRREQLKSTTVPVERILCHPRTGLGCLHEFEFVVLGPTVEAS